MNTPAHLILGAALFGRRDERPRTWAALAGSLMPDLSLYLMAGVSIYVLDIPARRVFRELYYSEAWQQVFAVDNSFVLWGIALALALWLRAGVAVAFCGAALVHIACDFPLHNHDARMHFWPLSEWRFFSPFSYWDDARGGWWFGLVEAALVAALLVLLWRRHRDRVLRATFAVIALAQIAPFFMWRLVF